MKRLAFLAIILLGYLNGAFGSPPEDIRSICGKYVKEEGVRIVGTSPAKFAKTGRLPLVGMENGNLDLSPTVRSLTSSYLMISVNTDVNKSLDADIASLLRDSDYKLMYSSNEGGELSAIYAIADADTVSSFLLCSIGERGIVLYGVDGNLSLAQVETIVSKAVPTFDDEVPAPDTTDEVPAPEHADLLSQRNDATASTSRVEMSDKDAVNYTDIYAYIRARVPDVMRGPVSVNSTPDGPMYIVDGIQVSDISYLRPIDVYSIEGVKGSATAIYGFRAVAGVIVITTKAAHIQQEAEEQERQAVREARRAAREAKKAAKEEKNK